MAVFLISQKWADLSGYGGYKKSRSDEAALICAFSIRSVSDKHEKVPHVCVVPIKENSGALRGLHDENTSSMYKSMERSLKQEGQQFQYPIDKAHQ